MISTKKIDQLIQIKIIQTIKVISNQQLKKWFVLMTRPRSEKRVGARLSESNIENFVPLKRELRQWRDRKKWVEMPLFNYYIFVQTTEKLRHEVFNHVGVTKYVSHAGKICTLSEEEIERVKRLCSFEGQLKIEKGLLNKGDEVEILEGHFMGLRAYLVTGGSKNKIKISIPSLSCFATVEMDKNNVQKVVA